MSGVHRFEDLRCWQEARTLSAAIERYLRSADGIDPFLVDQLRRAALSVQTNIAEGFERYTHNEFHRFLRIAKASAAETRALLTNAMDRGLLDPVRHEVLSNQAQKVGALTSRLMSYLRSKKRAE
jgi:four helix bundle protein